MSFDKRATDKEGAHLLGQQASHDRGKGFLPYLRTPGFQNSTKMWGLPQDSPSRVHLLPTQGSVSSLQNLPW